MTNLYELYNRYNNFDRDVEYEKFKKDIEIRCNNLIICGDSLPFHIRDIKPHKMLNIKRLEMDMCADLGIHLNIRDDVIIVRKLSGTLKYRHY